MKELEAESGPCIACGLSYQNSAGIHSLQLNFPQTISDSQSGFLGRAGATQAYVYQSLLLSKASKAAVHQWSVHDMPGKPEYLIGSFGLPLCRRQTFLSLLDRQRTTFSSAAVRRSAAAGRCSLTIRHVFAPCILAFILHTVPNTHPHTRKTTCNCCTPTLSKQINPFTAIPQSAHVKKLL